MRKNKLFFDRQYMINISSLLTSFLIKKGPKGFNKLLKTLCKNKILYIYSKETDKYVYVDKLKFKIADVYDFVAMSKITEQESMYVTFVDSNIIRTPFDRLLIPVKRSVCFTGSIVLNQHTGEWELANMLNGNNEYTISVYDNHKKDIAKIITHAAGMFQDENFYKEISLLYEIAPICG